MAWRKRDEETKVEIGEKFEKLKSKYSEGLSNLSQIDE